MFLLCLYALSLVSGLDVNATLPEKLRLYQKASGIHEQELSEIFHRSLKGKFSFDSTENVTVKANMITRIQNFVTLVPLEVGMCILLFLLTRLSMLMLSWMAVFSCVWNLVFIISQEIFHKMPWAYFLMHKLCPQRLFNDEICMKLYWTLGGPEIKLI